MSYILVALQLVLASERFEHYKGPKPKGNSQGPARFTVRFTDMYHAKWDCIAGLPIFLYWATIFGRSQRFNVTSVPSMTVIGLFVTLGLTSHQHAFEKLLIYLQASFYLPFKVLALD